MRADVPIKSVLDKHYIYLKSFSAFSAHLHYHIYQNDQVLKYRSRNYILELRVEPDLTSDVFDEHYPSFSKGVI
jgi:hypothetical protein